MLYFIYERSWRSPYLHRKMKPKVLYHASANTNLEVLEPRAESVRDEKEGPVVFASSDKAGVTKFLVSSNDSWTKKGRFGGIHYNIISDRQRYEKEDKGGAIYHLSSDTFELDETRGGARDEWTSRNTVKTIDKEEYKSGLQAQLDNRVQVFFTDKQTFDEIVKSDDYGNKIIRGLESENKKLSINYQEIPPLKGRSTKKK